MLRKFVGILLLFSLLTVKFNPSFATLPFKFSIEQSADGAEENKAGEEEPKQSESIADELLRHNQSIIYCPLNSVSIIPHNQGATSKYLSSPYLPPESQL